MIRIPRFRQEIKLPIFCVDDCIATYANIENRIYQALYVDELHMDFHYKDTVLEVVFSDEYLENLKLYGGIKIVDISETENLIDYLKEALEKEKNILMEFKGIECPWDWRYQSLDLGSHTFLLREWKNKERVFYGIDPFYQKEHVELKISQIMRGYLGSKTIEKQNILEMDLLEGMRDRIHSQEYYERLEEYIMDFTSFNRVKHELELLKDNGVVDEYKLENCKYIQSLLNCVYSRLRYAVMIEFLGEKYKITNYFENGMIPYIESSSLWEKLRDIVLKSIIMNRECKERERIVIIKKIISMEKKAAFFLRSSCEK